MRRALAVLTLILCSSSLVACGDSDTPADGGTDAGTKTIDITIEGDTVTPNGDRVDVGVDQKIELVVKADAAGEIHVHSDPEQEFEYEGTGEAETFELQIDRPGQVDIESHTLDQLIVKLTVQ